MRKLVFLFILIILFCKQSFAENNFIVDLVYVCGPSLPFDAYNLEDEYYYFDYYNINVELKNNNWHKILVTNDYYQYPSYKKNIVDHSWTRNGGEYFSEFDVQENFILISLFRNEINRNFRDEVRDDSTFKDSLIFDKDMKVYDRVAIRKFSNGEVKKYEPSSGFCGLEYPYE